MSLQYNGRILWPGEATMPIGTGSTVDAGHLFIIMLIVVRIFISRCRISYPIVRCVIVKWPCSVSLLCALYGSNDLFMKYGNTPNASNPNSNSIIWHKTYICIFEQVIRSVQTSQYGLRWRSTTTWVSLEAVCRRRCRKPADS